MKITDDRLSLRAYFSRHGFTVMIGSFILVMSFFYGLTRGLHLRRAHAAGVMFMPFDGATSGVERLEIPSGTEPMPLGNDIEVNGHAAEMLSFTSDRSPEALTDEQMARWRERGFVTAGKATARRGVAFAMDRETGDRYSFSAWSVPGPFQEIASHGRPVQGLLSVVVRSDHSEDVAQGVPDVPVMPGGKGGAVISSVDQATRSYSSVYTNPGSLRECVEYYRSELPARGWTERFAEIHADPGAGQRRSANASFVKGGEEIVLLFSPEDDGAKHEAGDEQTVVAVTRASRLDGRSGRSS